MLSLVPSLTAWLPELILSVGAMLVMLAGAVSRRVQPIAILTGLTLIAATAALWYVTGLPAIDGFFGLIALDSLSLAFRWLALGVILLTVLMALSGAEVEPRWAGEYLGLLLAVGVGLMLMAEATHLLMAYVAMELVSLSSYALVGLSRDARSSEAALKYVLFGALASGIMLFGMSWIFGMTGALDFARIQQAAQHFTPEQTSMSLTAVTLVLVGLAFKISMVPFHFWTPDVYEGAPIPVTAMLSVGPKAAGLALFARLIATALAPLWASMMPLLMVLTIVTMTVGNVVALVQTNVKRLLAYSTIGQVGYLLIGLVINTAAGRQAVLVYLVAYLFMNLGAFACVTAVCSESRNESLDAFRGLASRSPVLAACLTLFLLSLAGIPPLIGFIGKFLLFGAAIQAQHMTLAVAGAINSAIALYYYVQVIRQVYLAAPASATSVLKPGLAIRVALGICSVGTVWFGVFPNFLVLVMASRS